MIAKKLQQIDGEIYKVSRKIKILPYVLPINLFQEKRIFFNLGFNYNPQFRYRKLKIEVRKTKQKLNKIERELAKLFSENKNNGGLSKFFKNKTDEMIKEIELLENIGKKGFTKKSIALYGKPTQELVKFSLEKLKRSKNKEMDYDNKFTSSSIVRKKIEKILFKKGVRWRVKEFKKLASRIAVDPQTKTIKLRKGIVFRGDCLKCIIAHEIETHIARSENAKSLPFKIFKIGTAGYLTTEEGLAIYNERRVHQKKGEPYHYQRIYLRTVGVNWALKYSFKKMFNKFLSLGLDPEKAWEATIRVKRGLSDTSKPGGFTKDYLYLKGYFDIKNFIKNRGDIKKLFIGKVGIDDLNMVGNLINKLV